jgi:mycothiol synthase
VSTLRDRGSDTGQVGLPARASWRVGVTVEPMPAPTSEVTLRAPTLDDLPAAVAVINASSQRLRGRDDVDEAEIRGWWTQLPPFDLERDVVLAVRDGVVVGYGDLGDQAHDGAVIWLDVRGDALAEVHGELERRALERRAVDGVVRAVADESDESLAAVLRDRGYRPIRSSYRMGIELSDGTFSPRWPPDAAVRTAVEGVDEPLLHELSQRSFEDHWGHTPTPYDEWLHWLLRMGDPDPSLWFVAEVDRVPAGIAICRPREHGDPQCGWVSVLGVLREHRRAGLGTALLTHAFSEFGRRGLLRVQLGVDAESTTGAVALYERAGMRVLWRWNIWEKTP